MLINEYVISGLFNPNEIEYVKSTIRKMHAFFTMEYFLDQSTDLLESLLAAVPELQFWAIFVTKVTVSFSFSRLLAKLR